ncbi:MAG TPA: VOC family protein [Candidatus Acidoferrum sp.]
MPSEAVTKRISPMLAVKDMNETTQFYQRVLGFKTQMSSPDYAIVERDGQTIRLQKAASEEVMQCVRGHTEIYIEVSGIQRMWEHVKNFQGRYRIKDLFDRDCG